METAPKDPAPEADAQAKRPTAVPATFAQMRIRVGDQIPLEPDARIAGGRATVRVVGWLEGESLLVTMPQNAAGRVVLREGEQVLLRAFTGKSAFAFRATVLKFAYQPFAYLHLSFPDRVEAVEVRSSFRHSMRMAVTHAQGSDAAKPGFILNVGTTGALIETSDPYDANGGPLRISADFELHGVPVSIELSAQIRSAKTDAVDSGQPRHRYGVEFIDLKPNDRLVLGALLWYQMHEHPDRAA